MAYRWARPGQAQALPGLQARARLDPREFGQAGPGFTEAWPAWPVGNTAYKRASYRESPTPLLKLLLYPDTGRTLKPVLRDAIGYRVRLSIERL